jgi:two-component system sensor histidine kinase UhpB
MRTPTDRLSRRIVLINGAVFAVGTLLLAVSPATVSAPIVLTEIPVLAIGLAVILAANALLLRRSLAPIAALTERMARVDLLRGTDRVATPDNGDLTSLVEAFNAMLDRLETERSTSSGHALAAQEAERRRIARELHDEIGQGLTASLLVLRRTADRAPAELRDELHAVQETVRSCLDDVRTVARRLRPDVLEDLGLVSSLTALATEFADATDVTVTRSIDPDLPPLPADVELVLYRVAQESMTNIARHADARKVALSLVEEDGSVVLRVVDDGRGGVAEEGAGIRGMRERAMLVGARLRFVTQPGGGTEVRLEVPVGEKP